MSDSPLFLVHVQLQRSRSILRGGAPQYTQDTRAQHTQLAFRWFIRSDHEMVYAAAASATASGRPRRKFAVSWTGFSPVMLLLLCSAPLAVGGVAVIVVRRPIASAICPC